MTYSVLIIDDEPEIAEGISFLVGKYCQDCAVVALAYSGEDGYAKAAALKPDIVLTDIRMPQCDGLEMIQRLRKDNAGMQFVILSGYAEFDYARKAISLGVAEFITKPVEEEELRATLLKVCARIQKKRSNESAVESMKSTVYNYEIRDYLNGAEHHMDRIKSGLIQAGFPVGNRFYVCAVMEFANRGTKEQGNALLKEDMKTVDFMMRTVDYSSNALAIIFASEGRIKGEVLHSHMQKYARTAAKQGLFPNIGIGLPCRSIEELPKSFDESKCALNYKMIQGENCVISYEKISDIQVKPDIVSAEEVARLEECISRLDNEGIKVVVGEIFEKLGRDDKLSMTDLQLLSLNLVLSGMRKIPFAQLQINEFLGKNIFSLESIARFQTMEQLKNWIINTLQGMNELMLKDNLPEKKDLVQEAKKYIIHNYNKEISLNDISREFYINPYYFSQLFKKKTGITYQNYLIELRVERAKKLLDETDLKIYEVCETVGYADVNHFNRIFERATGMKPSEYRKRREEL